MEIPDKVEKAKLTFDGAVINVTINGAWQYLQGRAPDGVGNVRVGCP